MESLLVATQFGLGDARVGDLVRDVEETWDIELATEWSQGECSVRMDRQVGIGTIDNRGVVQTLFVVNPALRTVEDVGVGSTYDDIARAYPKWIAGMSGYTTDFGGRFVPIEISPYAQRPDHTAAGRHMMFELDGNDRVARYRVGAPPYVFHAEVCSSP